MTLGASAVATSLPLCMLILQHALVRHERCDGIVDVCTEEDDWVFVYFYCMSTIVRFVCPHINVFVETLHLTHLLLSIASFCAIAFIDDVATIHVPLGILAGISHGLGCDVMRQMCEISRFPHSIAIVSMSVSFLLTLMMYIPFIHFAWFAWICLELFLATQKLGTDNVLFSNTESKFDGSHATPNHRYCFPKDLDKDKGRLVAVVAIIIAYMSISALFYSFMNHRLDEVFHDHVILSHVVALFYFVDGFSRYISGKFFSGYHRADFVCIVVSVTMYAIGNFSLSLFLPDLGPYIFLSLVAVFIGRGESIIHERIQIMFRQTKKPFHLAILTSVSFFVFFMGVCFALYPGHAYDETHISHVSSIPVLLIGSMICIFMCLFPFVVLLSLTPSRLYNNRDPDCFASNDVGLYRSGNSDTEEPDDAERDDE